MVTTSLMNWPRIRFGAGCNYVALLVDWCACFPNGLAHFQIKGFAAVIGKPLCIVLRFSAGFPKCRS